jgi:hypothetical protein
VSASSPLARNLVLEGELLAVGRALDSVGVPFIVLKGIPLAHRLGLRLDERPLHDNDILVGRNDAVRAGRAIEELGYRPIAERTLAGTMPRDFQLAYTRVTESGATATVDLHWAAFTPSLYPVAEDVIWSRTEPFEHRGQSFTVFDQPLTLIHLAAHYAQHRFTEARVVHQFATAWDRWHATIDHDDLRTLARRTRQTHALVYAFLVAGTPAQSIESSIARRLHRRFPHGRDNAPPPDRDYLGALAAMQLARPTRWPRYLAALAFPPIETLSAITGRPVSGALYLEYALRPLRPAWRMLKRSE